MAFLGAILQLSRLSLSRLSLLIFGFGGLQEENIVHTQRASNSGDHSLESTEIMKSSYGIHNSESTATKSSSGEEFITLELENPSSPTGEVLFLSVTEISDWDPSSILRSGIVRIRTRRDRLTQSSPYFQALLGRSFSESSMNCISIHWDLESFISILQFVHGRPLEFTVTNFLGLLEGSLYFGMESVRLECERWLCGRNFIDDSGSLEISLAEMIAFWNFGIEHGVSFILESCKAWLAQNFAWAASSSSFHCIPYSLLQSCIEHPQLTVESEKQLCEALIAWVIDNSESLLQSLDSEGGCIAPLHKVRTRLLPLGFVLGISVVPGISKFAAKSIHALLDVVNDPSMMINAALSNADCDDFRIRLTQCTKKLDFSDCPQVTGALLLLSIIPFPCELSTPREWLRQPLMDLECLRNNRFMFSRMSLTTTTFEAVCEVNLSKCPGVHFSDIVNLLKLSFPSLRVFRASYNIHFDLKNMFHLIDGSPLITEIDLTVDSSPVMPLLVSIQSCATDGYQQLSGRQFNLFNGRTASSNLTKLTLEGRIELRDSDLVNLSLVVGSLSHLNLKGCTSLTDKGISKVLCKFKQLSSIIAADTYFGNQSVSCLCSGFPCFRCCSGASCDPNHSTYLAVRLHHLDLGGCKSIDQSSLIDLLEHAPYLEKLSLRGTALIDDALYHFVGCSLEALDICETMVSRNALSYIIRKNPKLMVLKARGCRHLSLSDGNLQCVGFHPKYDFLSSGSESTDGDNLDCALSRICIWEELRLGWGFYPSSLKILGPSIRVLRAITVGLGAPLGERAIASLPELCPILESVSLCFQVISDSAVRNILQSLKNLQVFELCCCLGELTSESFKISMPKLRRLKLQRVTPWMTDTDLNMLTQNCINLHELSLSGCKFLCSDSQGVISHGWPGLSLIHLEDCGKITLNGISSLLDCKVVEDLLLHHNGPGIPRNFIADAASKLPLLRKLAVDLCDARDGGFDSPSFAGRFFLNKVTIARCTSEKCAFMLSNASSQRRVLHKESIVLEWNGEGLRTSIVKERV